MELNDVYDENRHFLGRVHERGTPWPAGEYGLVVCVWVCDGRGRVLLTRRAPEKSFAGTWETSGGAARAGETSRQAVARELFEETGIRVPEQEFRLLGSGRDSCTHYDYYCVCRDTPISRIVLQPGETDGVQWASFEGVHRLIREQQICAVIARQFLLQETQLLTLQDR